MNAVACGHVLEISTADKIRSFAALAPGWHYGKGGPITGIVADLALEAEALLRSKGIITGAFAGDENAILVTGYLYDAQDRMVEIEIRVENDCGAVAVRDANLQRNNAP